MMVFKEQLLLKEHLDLHKEATLGLVPTMGALHSGHLALVEQAVKENDYVVVSIFVNPTQFDDQKDLNAYPKTLSADIQKLSIFGEKIFVYTPEVKDVYPKETKAEHFNFGALETTMEGASTVHYSRLSRAKKSSYPYCKLPHCTRKRRTSHEF